MKYELILHITPVVMQAALLENGKTVEFFIHSSLKPSQVGNIYLGRVNKVIPGMSCAFVDIGMERDAYLFVDDVVEEWETMDELFGTSREAPQKGKTSIDDILKRGQPLLVQIVRDSLPHKGPRGTTALTLPGYYLVYMPFATLAGVSKKIEEGEKREKLKTLAREIKQRWGGGWVIRTAALSTHREAIWREGEHLASLWKDLQDKAKRFRPPQLIWEDEPFPLQLIRDLGGLPLHRLVIDEEGWKKPIQDYLKKHYGKLAIKVHEGSQSIFSKYGVEKDLKNIFNPKVWLKSGGYIVIHATEALVAIDVNSGKFLGKREMEQTALKTNVEAAKEIARQIRLRNLGGIIVIDFIDMENPKNRNILMDTFSKALASDRARSRILNVNPFGLVEMTRKKIREDLLSELSIPCPHCDGLGRIKKPEVVCLEIYEAVRRQLIYLTGPLTLRCHPEVAALWKTHWLPPLSKYFKKHPFHIKEDPAFPLEKYQLLYGPA